jgi:hypothetical protein
MSNFVTRLQHNAHWFVLVAGIAIAVGAWVLWLFIGGNWAHRATLRQTLAPSIGASSAAANTKQVITVEPTAPTERERMFTERGQLGDSFGGLNALLTAIAGALVAWAGFMQHQMLKKTRETAQEERKHRELQQFESLFFQLLQLSADVTERIEGPKKRGAPVVTVPGRGTVCEQLPGATGPRALNAYAQSIFRNVHARPSDSSPAIAGLEALVKAFLTRVYDRQPSAFGPYYRIFYQTFKHIADSQLSEAEQIRYANIARGQISEGAVLLLALNGLTFDGYKFIPLIEKFGLLEHLHRRYRAEYEGYLQLGYRPRAFLGSLDRGRQENAWSEMPLLPAEKFLHLEQYRAEADHETDFATGFDPEHEGDQ